MSQSLSPQYSESKPTEASHEEKIYVIADEVLDVLKILYAEKHQQINSKLIAERMLKRDSVSKILGADFSAPNSAKYMKEAVSAFLDRFSELLPSPHIAKNIEYLKAQLHAEAQVENITSWLDCSIEVIQGYVNSISARSKELEGFLAETTKCIASIEQGLIGELAEQKKKFEDDRGFENNLSADMDGIKESFSISGDINSIKSRVFSKIGNLSKVMEKKREQDLLRLKDTEKALNEMKNKVWSMEDEARKLRKDAEDVAFKSLHDNLTGLSNREAYNKRIEETLANLRRYGVAASIMVCDIDHFKKVNDAFGHHIGDMVLKKVAELLRNKVRVNDFVARYGGEEFVVIMPHTTLDNAVIVGEKVRALIDESVFKIKDKTIPVTISIGVSAFRKEDDIVSAFERADGALYLAKRSGRNRVKTEEDVQTGGHSLSNEALSASVVESAKSVKAVESEGMMSSMFKIFKG